MALLMGVSAGASIIGAAAPAQEVEAHTGIAFGKTTKMKTARAVYYDKAGSPGAKEAGYYKGTTYTVGKVYKNGYYKVTIKGIKGSRWMHYTSVLGDL